MIPLYYLLMKNNIGSKRNCKQLIREGLIRVNDAIIEDCSFMVDEDDIVKYDNIIIDSSPLVYYMLNKPEGYISANKDKNPCVLDLFDRKDLSIAGRLDKDTTGLMILSNDKSLMKKITMPQYHLEKKYYVKTLYKIKNEDIEQCKKGIIIDNNILCKPALLEIIDDYSCYITLIEGKYHQVKKMFLSMNNQVIFLERIKIGDITLDFNLKRGEYRKLTKQEVLSLKQYV